MLKTKKLGKYWWIVGHEDGPMGPYDTKKEADEDRIGVNRSMRHANTPPGEPGCWTTDKRGKS